MAGTMLKLPEPTYKKTETGGLYLDAGLSVHILKRGISVLFPQDGYFSKDAGRRLLEGWREVIDGALQQMKIEDHQCSGPE